jgi:hypothetical protein
MGMFPLTNQKSGRGKSKQHQRYMHYAEWSQEEEQSRVKKEERAELAPWS